MASEHDDIVFYKNLSNNNQTESNSRFVILMKISEKTKKFFQPLSEWEPLILQHQNSDNLFSEFIPVHTLSNYNNGFLARSFPYTESLPYKPPFFVIFKNKAAITANYLNFQDFLKPSSETSVLALLTYNENNDSFDIKHSLNIYIPFSNSMQFNSVLEFVIIDTHGKIVNVENDSQLFISLQVYEKFPYKKQINF